MPNIAPRVYKTKSSFVCYLNMSKSIQELFDEYEEKSLEVEDAKKAFDESILPDLSTEKYVTVERADEHIIASIERERKEKELEAISIEWTAIEDTLVKALCRLNTKVMVKDKRDNTDLLIHCAAGNIVIEEMED